MTLFTEPTFLAKLSNTEPAITLLRMVSTGFSKHRPIRGQHAK